MPASLILIKTWGKGALACGPIGRPRVLVYVHVGNNNTRHRSLTYFVKVLCRNPRAGIIFHLRVYIPGYGPWEKGTHLSPHYIN